MKERRKYNRVKYGAFIETIENSVLRSWEAAIRKNELDNVPFTLIGGSYGHATNQENKVR